MVDLSVVGVFAREEGDAPRLLLHPHGIHKVISLRVSPVDAFALSMALQDRAVGTVSRYAQGSSLSASPFFSGLLSHGLILRLIETLGGRLIAVELPRLEQDEFVAELVLKTSAGFARLGCRPAEGIALALRCGALIRMARCLLAHASDTDAAMTLLSDYTCAVVKGDTALLPPPAGGASDIPTIPQEVEAALAGAGDRTDPSRNIINAAKKILEQQGLRENLEKILSGIKLVSVDQRRTRQSPKVEIKLVSVSRTEPLLEKTPGAAMPPAVDKGGDSGDDRGEEAVKIGFGVPPALENAGADSRRGPRIRVALVRQRGKGDAELIEEFQIPAEGISKQALAGLSLSRPAAEAAGRESSDEERWATLLRVLSPETKVPM